MKAHPWTSKKQIFSKKKPIFLELSIFSVINCATLLLKKKRIVRLFLECHNPTNLGDSDICRRLLAIPESNPLCLNILGTSLDPRLLALGK